MSKKNKKSYTGGATGSDSRFFIASEILFLLEYDEDYSDEYLTDKLNEILDNMNLHLSEDLGEVLRNHTVLSVSNFNLPAVSEAEIEKTPPPINSAQRKFARSESFGDNPPNNFTIIKSKLSTNTGLLGDDDLEKIMVQVNLVLEDKNRKSAYGSKKAQASPINQLEEEEKADRIRNKRLLRQTNVEDIHLQGVTFNFLLTGAPDQMGAGGPGSKPVPVIGPPIQPQPSEDDFAFTLPNDSKLKHPSGENATVFVLDTAHSCAVFKAIQERAQTENHILLKNLLPAEIDIDCSGNHFKCGNNFEVTLSDNILDVNPDDRYVILGHEYDMSDHSLFIAGIIRTIAPAAKIHLVQVLNSQGVGSIESITRGFLVAMAAADVVTPNTPVIFNCSFTMVTPIDGIDLIDQNATPEKRLKRQKQQENWNRWNGRLKHTRALSISSLILQYLCELAFRSGITMVAAAGNEGNAAGNEENAPKTRFPAASMPVIGVGAIDRLNKSTRYSNKSDSPLSDGIATQGGMLDDNQFAISGDGTNEPGLLGIFTRDFPENPNIALDEPHAWGWGWWAGTSFAAPIVSAVMAILQADQQQTVQDAQQSIRDMQPVEARQRAAILEVRQGIHTSVESD